MELITQISELRLKVKQLNSQLRNQDSKLIVSIISLAKQLNAQNDSKMGTGMEDQDANNMNFNQSRQSFEDNQFQAKELQIKRQYIEELRKKLNALVEENQYLKGEMGGNAEALE